MMNRFVGVVGRKVTTIVAVSLLSRSFVSPVLSLPYSTAETIQDSNRHPLSTNPDNLYGKEWLLNVRGGGDVDTKDDAKNVDDECTTTIDDAYSYRTVQVQVIHRHGDRTPITPLKDKEFWAQQLVPEDLLERVAKGTRVLRHDAANGGKNKLEVHAAAGRGPFGKLTKLGLLGMVQVGSNLKEDLEESTTWSERTKASALLVTNGENSGEARIKFSPKDIKVYSTDFARTIQSVQGLLVGFFPDGFSSDEIDIDCRGTTSWMIPDPQPRRTKEQEDLERQLAQRPHVLERDVLMKPLAARVTKSLLPLLGKEAFKISFGVEDNEDKAKEEFPTLPWIQLTEITKCLSVRDMLPDSITKEDQEALSAHTAWKWFQSLRTPRLAYLSMKRFTETLAGALQNRENEPPLIVYSCHDSSLIGLLCALRLEQPSVWPEYGALLKMELLEKRKERDTCDGSDVTHVVRFFLNGELLRSKWNDKPREEISMEEFISLVSTEVEDVKI